jgi:hypothetical protein
MSQSVARFDWDTLCAAILARIDERHAMPEMFWRTTPHPDWLDDCCGDSPVLSLAPETLEERP